MWSDIGLTPVKCLPGQGLSFALFLIYERNKVDCFFFILCICRCIHHYTYPSVSPARWIPGPGAKLALQWRLSDRVWKGAALFVLHGH